MPVKYAFIEEYKLLAPLTTFKIGGRARFFAKPENLEELTQSLEYAKSLGLKAILLGGGSNLLVDDGELDLLVVSLCGEFAQISHEAGTIVAGAGAKLHKVVMEYGKKGLGDADFLAGIPGTVGGALRMNAGAFGGEMRNLVQWADVLDDRGEIKRYRPVEMGFSYRESVFSKLKGHVILRCGLAEGANHEDPAIRLAKIREIILKRIQKQPKNHKNCGSVFKNPNVSAGELIEKAGLKGASIGGAMVAREHANWIVSDGATAQNVKDLVRKIQDVVFDKFEIALEREVIYLPDDFM